MSYEDAILFLQENCEILAPENRFLIIDVDGWRCVDGRVVGPDHRYAAPGGTLGFLFAVLAGVEAWAKQTQRPLPDFDLVQKAVSTVFPVMTYHTDDHTHDSLPCAGCGHCAGALAEPERYGIDKYVLQLRLEIDRFGLKTEILTGVHSESAVFIVPVGVALPGTGSNGVQVFVFHKAAWVDVLAILSRVLAEGLSVDSDELYQCIQKSAQRQLDVTLDRLAKGLPVYVVRDDGTLEE
jgi:hypothetical protein